MRKKLVEVDEIREAANRKLELRELMNMAFREKGIESIHDKRRIMVDVLGYKETWGSVVAGDIQRILSYVQSKSAEDLKSPIVGWLSVSKRGEGMRKHHMRELLTEIPADTGVVLLTVNILSQSDELLEAHAYVAHKFFHTSEDKIFEALKKLYEQENFDGTVGLYTLDRYMQVQPLIEKE